MSDVSLTIYVFLHCPKDKQINENVFHSHIESRNLKVPSGVNRGGFAGGAPQPAPGSAVAPGPLPGAGTQAVGGAGASSAGAGGAGAGGAAAGGGRRRESRAAGAARLFGYLEASDGSGDEYEPPPLPAEFGAAPHYARDKENAAPPPLHHALHHDHCLRY